MKTVLISAFLFLTLCAGTAWASTSEFTYQGQLRDNSAPANASYDFQFALFDAATGGTQVGSTQSAPAVSVANGLFTVTLDFGAPAFSGADRFLEISVKAAGGASFTTLTPRQKLTFAPYSITAKTALNTSGLAGQSVSATAPTNNQILRFSGGQWVPSNESGTSGAAGGDLSGTYPNPTVNAVSANANNAIVRRDASGNFSATTVTADLAGTAADASALNGQPASFYQNASNILSGTLSDSLLSGNVTVQGNTFNGVSQLVKLDATGKLPAVDGSMLTNVSASDAATLGGNAPAFFRDAGNINAGTLNDLRLSGNVTLAGNTFNGNNQLVQIDATGKLPAVNGSMLTNVNAADSATLGGQAPAFYRDASNTNAGTLNDLRLSGNVTLAGNTFNGNNQLVQIDATGKLPAVNGSMLTNIIATDSATLGGNAPAFFRDAGNINAGTLNDLRLSANVPLKNAANIFATGNQEIRTGADGNKGLIVKANSISQAGNLQEWQDNAGNPVALVTPAGVFIGNGSGLTNVSAADSATLGGNAPAFFRDAGNINAGTLNDLRLSANVPLKNAANIFATGNQEIRTGGDGNKGLIVKANSGTQGANLQEWQDSANNPIATLAPTGLLTVGGFKMPTGATSGYVLTSDLSGNGTWMPAAGGGANVSLSNLSSVAVNTSLLPGTTNSIDLGSSAKNWRQVFIGANGVAFEGATADGNRTTLNVIDPLAPRTISLPDASGTVALRDADNNFAVAQTFPANAAQGDKLISSLNAGTTAITDARLTNNIALLGGRAGGQSLSGGTSPGNSLTLDSTSDLSKGNILLAPMNGNVGIGTSMPTSTLALGGDSPRTFKMERNSAAGAGADLTVASGGAGSGGSDNFGGNLNLSSGISTGNGGSNINFQTVKPAQGAGSADRMPATAMVLTGSGHLGVGTNNPGGIIGVNGDAPQAIGMERNSVGNAPGNMLFLSAGGATPGSTNQNGGSLVLASGMATGDGGSSINFQTVKSTQGGGSVDRAPATAMVLSANGALGIGAPNPASALHIQQGGGAARVTIDSTTTNGPSIALTGSAGYNGKTFLLYATGSADPEGANSFVLRDNTASTNRLVVDGGGNIAIGAPTANARLDVAQTATIAAVSGTQNGTGAAGTFSINNGGNAFAALTATTNSNNGASRVLELDHTGTSGDIAVFKSGGSPVAKIDKNGVIGMTGSSLKIVSQVANFNIDDTMGICLLNTGGITATLPSAAGRQGRIFTIKMIVGGSACTVNTAGGNIDGNSAVSLSTQNKYVTVVSDGTNWFIVANN